MREKEGNEEMRTLGWLSSDAHNWLSFFARSQGDITRRPVGHPLAEEHLVVVVETVERG